MQPTRHVLLAVRNGRPEIERIMGAVDSSGAWREAVDAQLAREDERIAAGVPAHELHYCVRDSDHEYVTAALAREAAKLGDRQKSVLRTFYAAAPTGKLKPGSRKVGDPDLRRWDVAAAKVGLKRAWDFAGVAMRLADHGYLLATGEAYAPKTYQMTVHGRLLADHLNDESK